MTKLQMVIESPHTDITMPSSNKKGSMHYAGKRLAKTGVDEKKRMEDHPLKASQESTSSGASSIPDASAGATSAADSPNAAESPNTHNRPRLSEAQEDYLKEIFKLRELNQNVTMQDLAQRLEVRPASVTGMIKKLSKMGLVDYKPYKGAHLTDLGEAIALEVLRHHRLLELYLADHLNYSWDEIHEEAERLEHVISEKFEAAISELMGHPTHDPHGDPIPSVNLEIPDSPSLKAVNKFDTPASATIRRVMTQDRDILNMISRLELTIDQEIAITGNDKTGVRIKVSGNQYFLPHAIARYLWAEESKS